MTLQLKRNPKITFSAPNIRLIKTPLISWYKVEHAELESPHNYFPASSWKLLEDKK